MMIVDACPNEKESWNKYNDHDGCPDIAPEQSRYKHDADLDDIINDEDICVHLIPKIMMATVMLTAAPIHSEHIL